MLNTFYHFVKADLQLTWRQAHAWLTPLAFFVLVVCLFPIGVSTEQDLLIKIAPGIIWVAVLLAILMSLHRLFQSDAEEGALDLYVLSPYPFTLFVFSKIMSHWILYCLPLILISPLLGVLLHLSSATLFALLLSLLLGTPALCMLGAIGASLLVNLRHPGLLLPLFILPLYIPILIFGTSMVYAASLEQPLNGYIAILSAMTVFSASFAPFFTGLALRLGVSQ